jgi:catechol 2,3-dioxygenase-like lactoylglutathione lyase family enzyme
MTSYRLHHVQVSVPPGSEAVARGFYVGVLGMEELPKPPALAARGGVWLRLAGTELHLGVEPGFRPAGKAHPAFEVDDLVDLRHRLELAGAQVRDDDLLPGRRRFYTEDPFGNRLEFVGKGEP